MKRISIFILITIVFLASCKKTPEVNLKYVDVERDLVTVGTTTANIQCDYDYIATLKKAYLYYGEGEDETNMTSAEMSVVQKTLYVELTGLKENTTYSYYYEFVNGFNSMRSALKTFKTETSPGGITLPTVITAAVTEITTNSAKGGGEVTNDGGAEVTERGICWSINGNPTLNDSHVTAGTGTGSFIATMNGLEANATYHVRAYATNEAGTAYGMDKEFSTLSGGSNGVPEGAINGLFTINEYGDQVYFSQGNLQYQASTNTWRFAENQWDYVGTQTPDNNGFYGGTINGSDNKNISETYSGWIDLFGWATSGYHDSGDPYNVNYQPWSISQSTVNEYYNWYGYGPSINMVSPDLTASSASYDWGVYNQISNGGNVTNQWRTLTYDQWFFVFCRRTTISGILYAMANINGVNGAILLPDDWNADIYYLNSTNNTYNSNVLSASQWSILEANGAVFLPAAGRRDLTSVECAGFYSRYWCSTSLNVNAAKCIDFYDGYFQLAGGNDFRFFGRSVRLVQDANP